MEITSLQKKRQEYYAKNKQNIIEKSAKYYADNKQKVLKRVSDAYKKNPIPVRSKAKIFAEKKMGITVGSSQRFRKSVKSHSAR